MKLQKSQEQCTLELILNETRCKDTFLSKFHKFQKYLIISNKFQKNLAALLFFEF
jgi:hypothetical protein